MKIKSIITILVTAALIAVFATFCKSCKEKKSETGEVSTTKAIKSTDKPLNISIYIDLSDRLVRQMTPCQKDKDIEIISYMAEILKNHSVSQKILPSKDRIKVFFYPSPNDSKISLLANDLEMDLSRAQAKEKKKILVEFQDKFKTSLNQIYDTTLAAQNWVGSDIWGFFKKQVDTYCIEDGYRNIIVILTDGYIYHSLNKIKDGNNYSYILPQTLENPNSGLIVYRKGLENLEVLMLEINPLDPKKQDQMEHILEKWLSDMGVTKFYVGETDQPSNTKLIIDKFMKE